MNKTITEILNNDEALSDYVKELEKDIDNTEKTSEQVDEMLSNILNLLDNFKDRRALRGSTMDAVTNLLRLKADLPMNRIKAKNDILKILTKKKEMEIKAQQATATEALAAGVGNSLSSILNRLDNEKIHPRKLTDEEIKTECYTIIDVTKEEEQKKEELAQPEQKQISADDVRNMLDNTL